MHRSWLKGLVACWTAVGWIVPASPAVAQDALDPVRAHYASAKYEEALAILTAHERDRRPEVEQYRVFCLVALGRIAEAEQTVASVVAEAPAFIPAKAETPPRIQEMFARIRRQLVPAMAQRWYLEARAAFVRKDTAVAEAQFASLVQLIDSITADDSENEDEQPMLSELRLLASGFLDLSRSAAVRPVPPARQTSHDAGTSPTSLAPAVIAPVARRQQMPAWVPPDNMSRQASFYGAIRVLISAEGRVTSARIERSVHPAYDRVLLQAARDWDYQPAIRDGVPIPSEQLVQVQLKPRQ